VRCAVLLALFDQGGERQRWSSPATYGSGQPDGGVGAELGRRTDGGPGSQRRATDPACSDAVASMWRRAWLLGVLTFFY
jgi:hypothetical protein